jgi:putative CocE/NonD family hydrolase
MTPEPGPDYRVEFDVPATMSDGTVLRADVYRPAAAGRYPVLLMRTPYGKSLAQQNVYAHPSVYTRSGFIVVVQDVRGRYASAGTFYPLRHERADGRDTVAWCRTIAGSDGRVFLYGYSYAGFAALLAAAARPDGLVGIMPAMTSADAREGWLYRDGVLRLGFAYAWALQLAEQEAVRRGDDARAHRIAAAAAAVPGRLPVRGVVDADLLECCPYFVDWVDRRDDDGYWAELGCWPDLAGLEIPTMLVAGWYDEFLAGTLAAHRRLVAGSRVRHQLVIGPWCHAPWTRYTGALDFGPAASPDIDQAQIAWARRVLDGDPPDGVRYFTLGENRWHTASTWPPAGTATRTWFLHAERGAHGADGDGRLAPARPGAQPPDHLWVDPARPVPSLRGKDDPAARTYWGPVDQSSLDTRRDVLYYSTAELAEPLTIAGPVTLSLWVTPATPNSDIHASLCDVHPDGRSYPISRGVARGRAGPGLTREIQVKLDDTSAVVAAGHRLRLVIAGTSFPAFVRHPQSDVRDVDAGPGDLRVATHQIHHDADRPSRLTVGIRDDALKGESR